MKFLILYLLLFVSIEANADKLWSGWPAPSTYPDGDSCIAAAKTAWIASVQHYIPVATCTFTPQTFSYGKIKLTIGVCTSGSLSCAITGCSTVGEEVPNCAANQTYKCADDCTCACDPPIPTCIEPEPHPCDFYDPQGSDAMFSKNIQCKLGIEWDQATCAYKHKDGCTTADGYSGPFGGYVEGGPGESDLGKMTCIHGCNYVFDEYNSETGALHSSLTIQSCSTPPVPPTGEYDDEKIQAVDDTWEPDNDLDTGTNCGEFNGEYLCVDTIPNGTCVTTPGGSYVCVSPPSVTPDTPVPLSPDIRIRTPGPNPTDPGDDDYTDFYKKPPPNTVPTCPDGYTYTAGKCVKPPLVDGTCPTGSTLINGVCVYDKDLGGPFAGPGGSMGPGLGGPPAFSYLDTLNTFFDKVRNSPLLDFSPNCGGGSASCPALAILGTTTTIHCDLAENAVPMFSAFLWLVGGLVAIRAVFSA